MFFFIGKTHLERLGHLRVKLSIRETTLYFDKFEKYFENSNLEMDEI